MKKETKEIVALTEKWLEKISAITVDYQKAIQSLADARGDYKAQTKRWYQVLLTFLQPLLYTIIILIALGFILHFSGCPNPIDIKFQGLEITQHCSTAR